MKIKKETETSASRDAREGTVTPGSESITHPERDERFANDPDAQKKKDATKLALETDLRQLENDNDEEVSNRMIREYRAEKVKDLKSKLGLK